MDDFNALAAALAAGVADVRGCLILSRDGLILGGYPQAGEQLAKPAWLRLAVIGDFERGFLQFGTEVWCYVRRGPYAAFVLTGHGVRPGLVIDQIEQALLTAEEARAKREGLKAPEAAIGGVLAPSGKPRAPLHPEPRPTDQPVVISAEALEGLRTPSAAPHEPAAREAQAPQPPTPEPPAPEPAAPEPAPTGPAVQGPPAGPGDDEPKERRPEGEVDRFSLAREFSQLLQDDGATADG